MVNGLLLLSGLPDRGAIERLHHIPLAHYLCGFGTAKIPSRPRGTGGLLPDLVPDLCRFVGRLKQMSHLSLREREDVLDVPSLELREKSPDYESESPGGILEMFGKPSTRGWLPARR